MNKNNLFDYCLDNIETQNKSIYYIGNVIGNSLLTISIDTKSQKIYSYSNEWLYLVKCYYPSNEIYNRMISKYLYIINNKKINCCYSNYNVIPFISSFSNGSVHSYAGLYCILNEYITNYNIYKDYKIIVYSDIQQGLLDIINNFVEKNIINKEKIIYISSHVQYLFNSIRFPLSSYPYCSGFFDFAL